MTCTLSIDVGGTGIKALVLNDHGEPISERSRVETPYPCPPELFLETVRELVAEQPPFDRVSMGFPSMVRDGRTLRVVPFARAVKSGARDPELYARWDGYRLQHGISEMLGVPALLINDADMQGCAVVTGEGVELVITLGTGVGTGLFLEGRLLPHLELSQGEFGGDSVDIAVGDAQRREVGNKRWRLLVTKALTDFDAKIIPDKIYVGGGNSKHLRPEDLIDGCEIVPNTAGLLGGARAWELAK
ncbi:MAG: ROK family protein [Candidatus Nanopelagicales bacterium]|nr:ROK family protein [Candidatus Nanopelagicales bacterium]